MYPNGTNRESGERNVLQSILLGSAMAILFALLNAANFSSGFTAISMGAAFVAAIIYSLMTEA